MSDLTKKEQSNMSEGFQINIDAEAVNKMVADAVLKSALGKAVEDAVKRNVQSLSVSWNNPLDDVIQSHVATIVRETLIEKHGDEIKNRITDALAKKLSDEFISSVVEKAASRY